MPFMQGLMDTVIPVLSEIPNPPPQPPPRSERILEVVGNIKWIAGVALLAGFLAGVLAWGGGRWIDHHKAGRYGLIMILCSLGGALLYSAAWPLITHFAGG